MTSMQQQRMQEVRTVARDRRISDRTTPRQRRALKPWQMKPSYLTRVNLGGLEAVNLQIEARALYAVACQRVGEFLTGRSYLPDNDDLLAHLVEQARWAGDALDLELGAGGLEETER